MAKYLIHACKPRMWYVDGFLIPSMTAQGVARGDISVWVDKDNVGCLESCFRAFESVPDDADGTWHLQDDVVISRRFRELTERYNTGIVCGHAWYKHKDRINAVGSVQPERMWFSFQCIRIPNYVARGCARYYRETILTEAQFEPWRKARRYDDTVFDLYVRNKGVREQITNLVPNLVAHIDYLIGGTVANERRIEPGEEPYFDESETIENLKRWLDGR